MKFICYIIGHKWIEKNGILRPFLDKDTGFEYYLCNRCEIKNFYKQRYCIYCKSTKNLTFDDGYTKECIKCPDCRHEDEKLREMQLREKAKTNNLIKYHTNSYVSGTLVNDSINEYFRQYYLYRDKDVDYIK